LCSRQPHPCLLYTQGYLHRPFKQRGSHGVYHLAFSVTFHVNSLSTLSTDMTSHCSTLLHTYALARSTLLPSHFKHGHDLSLLHTSALARQEKRSPFAAPNFCTRTPGQTIPTSHYYSSKIFVATGLNRGVYIGKIGAGGTYRDLSALGWPTRACRPLESR
jgi:hypothetical protein